MNEKEAGKLGEIWATQEATLEGLRRLGDLNEILGAWDPDSLDNPDMAGMSLAERVTFAVQAGLADEAGDEWTTEQAVSFWKEIGFNADDRADNDAVKAFAVEALAALVWRENAELEMIRLRDLEMVGCDAAADLAITAISDDCSTLGG